MLLTEERPVLGCCRAGIKSVEDDVLAPESSVQLSIKYEHVAPPLKLMHNPEPTLLWSFDV